MDVRANRPVGPERASLVQQRLETRRCRGDVLRTVIELPTVRSPPPTDPSAFVEHDRIVSGIGQAPRTGEPGHTGADDCNSLCLDHHVTQDPIGARSIAESSRLTSESLALTCGTPKPTSRSVCIAR